MKLSAKAVAPLLVVIVGLATMLGLFAVRRAPVSNRTVTPAPIVETVEVRPDTAVFTVKAEGTVAPRTESELVTEVAGRILWISPRLATGAFFATGDVLARIDARDYEATLEGARAALGRAESELALAGSALGREQSMGRGGATSQSKLERAQHTKAAAQAGVREARVAVDRAQYDLERCEVRAPFAGRVRDKFVDVGEFLNRGDHVARIYAVDYAEIRLPISDRDLAYLDLGLGYRDDPLAVVVESTEAGQEGEPAPTPGPEVQLSADFAGRRNTWRGHVVRVEGALDPKTRMVNVVARVDDPYGRGDEQGRPPLAVGLFVEAEIQGRAEEGLFAVPRAGLRGTNEVALVDADERLRMRSVEIVRAGSERVWVRSGLVAGERVITSPLGIIVDGMRVRTSSIAPVQTVAAEDARR